MMMLPGGVQSTCKHPYKLPSMIAFLPVSLVHVSALGAVCDLSWHRGGFTQNFKNEASLPCKPLSGVLRGSSLLHVRQKFVHLLHLEGCLASSRVGNLAELAAGYVAAGYIHYREHNGCSTTSACLLRHSSTTGGRTT